MDRLTTLRSYLIQWLLIFSSIIQGITPLDIDLPICERRMSKECTTDLITTTPVVTTP